MALPDMARLEELTRRPLRLVPNRVYRLWKGGALLDRLQGKPHPEDTHFPEEWVGSTTVTRLAGRPPDEGLSRVLLPDGATVALRSLIEEFPEAMLGAAHVARHGRELGVLCKLLDAAMQQPIQCHPDRAFARQYLGMGCFNHLAKGPAYVEQHTLAPRILHEDPQGREETLIGPENTPCFGASRLTVWGTVPDRDRGWRAIGIVIEGRGWLTGPGDDMPLQPGTTLFLPAASRHHGYRSTPGAPLTVIKCFPPSGDDAR